MDSNTAQAVTALAEKLGTTTEYLWGVLLKQAPISGAVSLFMVIFLIVLAQIWTRFIRRKVAEANWRYEEDMICGISVGVAQLVAILATILTAPDIIYALFNPEYWALMQILGK